MPRRYVMAISCICHYRPAHKLVTAHLECRAPLRVCPLLVSSLPTPALSLSLSLFRFGRFSLTLCFSLPPRLTSFRLLFVALCLVFLLFFFFSPFFCILPSTCHRVVCIVVAKRRSLSSLINVDPLLIYRRVALKANDALPLCLSERTTLGIPVAR